VGPGAASDSSLCKKIERVLRRITLNSQAKNAIGALEHVAKKLLDFFDYDMLQILVGERFLFVYVSPCGRLALEYGAAWLCVRFRQSVANGSIPILVKRVRNVNRGS